MIKRVAKIQGIFRHKIEPNFAPLKRHLFSRGVSMLRFYRWGFEFDLQWMDGSFFMLDKRKWVGGYIRFRYGYVFSFHWSRR